MDLYGGAKSVKIVPRELKEVRKFCVRMRTAPAFVRTLRTRAQWNVLMSANSTSSLLDLSSSIQVMQGSTDTPSSSDEAR